MQTLLITRKVRETNIKYLFSKPTQGLAILTTRKVSPNRIVDEPTREQVMFIIEKFLKKSTLYNNATLFRLELASGSNSYS